MKPPRLPMAEYPAYRPHEDPRLLGAQRDRLALVAKTRLAVEASRAVRLSLEGTMRAAGFEEESP
jgi:hypothetical protein